MLVTAGSLSTDPADEDEKNDDNEEDEPHVAQPCYPQNHRILPCYMATER